MDSQQLINRGVDCGGPSFQLPSRQSEIVVWQNGLSAGWSRCGEGKCYGRNGWCGCLHFEAQAGDRWRCTCGHRYDEHGS